MVTKEEIEKYINNIPPLAENLKTCIKYLKDGELSKASKSVEKDPALNNYLVHIINKPIYGFTQEVKNTIQIFGILGVIKSRQMLTSYLISLLAPKKWVLFKIDNYAFNEFQAAMMGNWNRILEKQGFDNSPISTSATLLASAIIVCEEMFKDKKDAVDLIRERNYVDYNTILKRLSGYSLFDIAIMIGKKWEIEEDALKVILYSDGKKEVTKTNNTIKLAKYLHLLLFHSLSNPTFVEHGLNDFIEFNPEFVNEISEDFMDILSLNEVKEDETNN